MRTISFLILLLSDGTWSISVGWKSYIKENPTEFQDLPLAWDLDTQIPDWLSGTYIRNGPAQISFESEHRHLASWLEGFAKLHSFKISGSKVLYSGKMLESPNYLASKERGEMVPMMTLNKFADPKDEWNWWEKLQIMVKMFAGTEFGNNNPALWRIGPMDEGIYLAVTDGKVPTRFNLSSLETLGMEYPAFYPFTLTGCAHWMREPGTDNSINFNYKKGLTGKPWVDVLRYRPEHTYQTPEVIASFTPTKFSYIHSFSVTEHYVVFLFYPVVIDRKKIPESNFHVMEMLDGSNKTDTTDVFVVDTKTGSVLGPFHTDWIFSLHHINAYESSDTEIIVDVTPSPFENMREYLRMENILNPPLEGSPEAEVSTTDKLEITRYKINLKSGEVVNSHFPNTINSRYINTFDFPTINEAYRGKKYCYVYGVSAFAYSRTALVKKNVCNPDDDKVYYLEDHYMTEMHFLPNPASRAEDDGILITIGFAGVKEQSYLLLIDATSFLPINTAFLPHNIPWSAHGMHFPEATWSLDGRNHGLKEEL